MNLLSELVNAPAIDSTIYNAVLNVHGLYNTEQFVLRLSPKNHRLINAITGVPTNIKNVDADTVQAYSTYLHETIHWWQHVGSTTGLVMSLCYPLQSHSNVDLIRMWCEFGGMSKSIKKSALEGELLGKDYLDPMQGVANEIVNNTMDFEFFKKWILQPDRSSEILNNTYFESQGHCFMIAYAHFCSYVYEMLGEDSNLFHDSRSWGVEFERLAAQKVIGYYHGSPMFRRRVGVVEIFEGQACFSQMQFLSGAFESLNEIEEFKRQGLLHGVYEKAFNEFIVLSGFGHPIHTLDPIVGLFLLICDLSINPMMGFPCPIKDFSSFVNHADPGIRFEMLCVAAGKIGGDIICAIHSYSEHEYINVSTQLLNKCGLAHPSEGWDLVKRWVDENVNLQALMKEYDSYNYSPDNIVMRVMFSHFVSFTLDKRECPEFFCWPGYWKANMEKNEKIPSLWLKNLSLFSDREDDNGIFMRHFPGKDPNASLNTFNQFFAQTLIYDLSRQWILKDGDFSFDFKWLSEKHEEHQWKAWADSVFEKIYGVKISNITSG